jgi:alkylation response protein AidB-like acyl-CoA dehydrogenase
VKNPFRNPESERFDPFGELQEKAREERRRYLEESRREAEEAREREVQRQLGEKEKMGLGMPQRKGSGVTIDGVGILDRSGGYR